MAVNEIREREEMFDLMGNPKPGKLQILDRAGVFKIKYLFYF